jgi:hypothetical protein
MMADELARTEEKAEVAVQEQETDLQASKPGAGLSYMDGKELNRIYKNAVILAKSQLLPQRYRDHAEDVMLLMDLASRMGVSLFALAKGTYPVHGEISMTGQFCIALINSCGKFTPLSFVFVGDEGQNSYGCYAIATRTTDQVVCKSETITIQMTKDEGWFGRNSKWKTMTRQMLMYRAGSFFLRTFAPEIGFGMYTTEELEDVYGTEQKKEKQKTKVSLNIVDAEYTEEEES